jgi:transcriptional regulator with XRE-family HTH domain
VSSFLLWLPSALLILIGLVAAGAAWRRQRDRDRLDRPVLGRGSSARSSRPRSASGSASGDRFGARLRAERERRGITLEAVAAETKIGRALLVDLERSDLSKWPEGIFRRSFIREYAKAVGLDPDRVADEFARVFSEDAGTGAGVTNERRRLPRSDALRLSLDAGARSLAVDIRDRVVRAAVDLSVVLTAGAAAAWLGAPSFITAVGVAAFIYYPLAMVALGQTPASHLAVRLAIRTARRRDVAERRLHLVPRPSTPPSTGDAGKHDDGSTRAASG